MNQEITIKKISFELLIKVFKSWIMRRSLKLIINDLELGRNFFINDSSKVPEAK